MGPPVRTPHGWFRQHQPAFRILSVHEKTGFGGFKSKPPTKPSVYNSQGQPRLEVEGVGIFLKQEKDALSSQFPLSYPEVLMGTQAKPLDLFFWNEKTIQEYTISLTENQDIYV